MSSKLGFHIQEYNTVVRDAIQAVQPTTVKVMGNALNAGVMQEVKRIVPETLLIGRFWKDTSEQRYEVIQKAEQCL